MKEAPPDMFTANLGQIAEITKGRLLWGDPGLEIRGVSTDSRQIPPGVLFVALRGERFDGHEFVDAARQAGALAAVVSRQVPSPIPQVVVQDTLEALGCLAHWWRTQRAPLVIAVTGSAGKTTTKGMIAAILARRGRVLSNPGTQNNEIGLPTTLLRLHDEQYCVLEMGARAIGDIEYLAAIARPQIGVITHVGEAHLGVIGGREKVAQAKSELVVALPPDGAAVLNAEDYFFGVLAEMASCRVISFGLAQGDFRAEEIVTSAQETSFVLVGPVGRRKVTIKPIGKHNVCNALAAAAASWAAGAKGPDIVAGLGTFQGEAMRTQLITRSDGTVIINDAYNASPTSVRAALELLAEMEGRKVFVFGDMLELGDYAEEAHRRVGEEASAAGVKVMVAVGELAGISGHVAETLGVQVMYARTAEEARELAAQVIRSGDVVLVKASRMVGLERVVHRLQAGETARG
jgi:UDP-N-acetylmuramoyl-tripeptide--D-alanyl-D-alanine ligase